MNQGLTHARQLKKTFLGWWCWLLKAVKTNNFFGEWCWPLNQGLAHARQKQGTTLSRIRKGRNDRDIRLETLAQQNE